MARVLLGYQLRRYSRNSNKTSHDSYSGTKAVPMAHFYAGQGMWPRPGAELDASAGCHYPVHRVGSRGSENKCLSSLRPSLVLPPGTRTRPPTPPPVSDAGLTGVQGVADRGKARWEGALVHQDLDIGQHILLRILRGRKGRTQRQSCCGRNSAPGGGPRKWTGEWADPGDSEGGRPLPLGCPKN